MANTPIKEQIIIDFIQKILEEYPFASTAIVISIAFILISSFVILLLSVLGFFKGYKVTFFPPSFDPAPAKNSSMEQDIKKIVEKTSCIQKNIVHDKSINELVEIINTNENKVDELLQLVKFITNRINHIERQAILPNYRIPELSSLITIDAIRDKINGKIILLKLDLDIPPRDDTGILKRHIKFQRSLLSIEILLSIGAKILLLIGQGVACVDEFEKDKKEYQLQQHAKILQDMSGNHIKFIALNNIPSTREDINKYDDKTILVLPNLAKVSPEDIHLFFHSPGLKPSPLGE